MTGEKQAASTRKSDDPLPMEYGVPCDLSISFRQRVVVKEWCVARKQFAGLSNPVLGH